MTPPVAKLAFFKLNVPDLAEARSFWQRAFGFAVVGSYDLPDFAEDILAIPGEEGAPQLMLVQSKPAGDVSVGPGHGPIGFVCPDIAASFAHAQAEGASLLMEPTDVGGVIVAMLASPQGHQIELVQILD